jgi:ribosomal protein S18 acetylase RimI-like enzyme
VTAESITYLVNTATVERIAAHLAQCDAYFVPTLSSRVVLPDYALKIFSEAVRFEAWSGDVLVGLLAAYCNDPDRRVAYITNVSILAERTGEGIARRLLLRCIEHVRAHALRRISLEVASHHGSAIRLYEKCGFSMGEINGSFSKMNLDLERWEAHEHQA